MFRKGNDDRPGNGTNGGKRGLLSILGQDVVIEGNISAGSDLHIDGRVEGDVVCATLAQGVDSHIVGGVRADVARIAGTIEGSIRARELTVERSARIAGDVEYTTVSIETGAQIDGRMHHVAPDEAIIEDDDTQAPAAPANILFMGAGKEQA